MASISRSVPRLAAGARVSTLALRTGLPQTCRAARVNRANVFHNITGRRLGSTAAAVKSGSKAPEQSRARSKVFKDADEAVADIQSGSTLLSSGFGLCGVAGKTDLSITLLTFGFHKLGYSI